MYSYNAKSLHVTFPGEEMDIIKCPSILKCSFFNCLKLHGTANILKNLYCKLRFEKCVRYQMKQRGEEVPEKLWPNGQTLGQK